MPGDTEAQRKIRPRMSHHRRAELLAAVCDVLCQVGYEAMTMDAVAARARCSKATLYRHWGSKQFLVAAALYATRPAPPPEVDTGSLRGDLLRYASELTRDPRRDTAVLAALGHAVLREPELGPAVRDTLIAPHTERLRALVDRAVRRGEVSAASKSSLAYLPEALLGVAVTRPLFEGAYADAGYLARFVETLVRPSERAH